ncbi:MAG TPA: ATP-binding cassette domain-containing protein, partial [Acidobacteriota bacterium]|nr:ATP-binding cassette domain-containing protein [Acidobacteriota bacterium]
MIVSVRSVRKRFGNFCAVDGVEMGVPPGVIYGLLGPNGAGKTTTIRMILGIFLPDEGSIDVFGKPMDDAARDRIGYLPEERG